MDQIDKSCLLKIDKFSSLIVLRGAIRLLMKNNQMVIGKKQKNKSIVIFMSVDNDHPLYQILLL